MAAEGLAPVSSGPSIQTECPYLVFGARPPEGVTVWLHVSVSVEDKSEALQVSVFGVCC